MAALLQLYRFVNIARFVRLRLPVPRLNSVALRAHVWLASLQAGVTVISWVLTANIAGEWLLAAIVLAQLLSTALLVRSSIRTWQHTRPLGMPTPLHDKQLPTLSVLVPARNETDILQRCLEHLIASDYPKLEIIVLDDNSTNRHTSEVIRSFAHAGVRFIQGAAPDDSHWLAKNQAYARLRAEANGELLLFCGVDALFAPNSLRLLVEILYQRNKDMLSVLPLRADVMRATASLLQPMRYYWELCLPRRFFKRPPVLSTCWLVRATMLDRAGGFQAVAHSVIPESYFAKQAVVTDAYSFIRSDAVLGITSGKPIIEQYDTTVRTRYPQLHRRLELVAFASLLELVVMIGPILGLLFASVSDVLRTYALIWAVCVVCLLVTYYFAAVATGLNSKWMAWLLMPLAFVYDIFIAHVSLYKYEFSQVEWKGRDITPAVMEVIPHLPKV